MSKKQDETQQRLMTELERLQAEVDKLKKIDADNLFTSSRRAPAENDSRPRKPKANEKPDWVKSWNRQNASHGPVKTLVKTTDTYHEDTGIVETKTELVEPVITVEYARDLATGEVEEIVKEAGLPEHLRLDKQHEDRKPPILWSEKPTHDGLIPSDLGPAQTAKFAVNPNNDRAVREYLAANPGNPLDVRDEGPTKPVRKQMTRLNKVWKYRNFKKCGICESYDTWEARTDPYDDGVRVVHAEVWCHTCGATDFEVSDHMPAHIGSWAPRKETTNEAKKRRARQMYRRERSIFSLVESPKTAAELTAWFRDIEHYEAVDFIMIELMLKRMQSEGLVHFDKKSGKWWESEDYSFEHGSK